MLKPSLVTQRKMSEPPVFFRSTGRYRRHGTLWLLVVIIVAAGCGYAVLSSFRELSESPTIVSGK